MKMLVKQGVQNSTDSIVCKPTNFTLVLNGFYVKVLKRVKFSCYGQKSDLSTRICGSGLEFGLEQGTSGDVKVRQLYFEYIYLKVHFKWICCATKIIRITIII